MFSRIVLSIQVLLPEKFLNKLIADGVNVISACRPTRRNLVLTLTPSGAVRVRALAEKFSLKCETLQVSGAAVLVDYLRGRPTILVAYALMAVALALFLSRIWIVNVQSLGGIDPDYARETLVEAGAVPGAPAGAVDLSLLALKLSALEGVSYASAALEGVTLVVEMAGEDAAPDVYDISQARDLVAASDGVVLSVNVKSGTAMVSAGDTVRRGQVLISGEERVSNEQTQPVGALGSVIARSWAEGAAEGAMTQTVKDYTGRTSASARMALFDFEWQLTRADAYTACDQYTETIPVGGLFLPLEITRTVYREYTPRVVDCDIKALKEELMQQAFEAAETQMTKIAPENAEIIDKWADFSIINTDTLRARAVIEYSSDIAVTRQYLEDN